MRIHKHQEPGLKSFLKRTISAQTHLIGAMAAIIALYMLLQMVPGGVSDRIHFFACLSFGLTAILVFATSSIYHFISDGFQASPRLEQLLEDLDHFSIYLFIAGTYTPFLLNTVAEPWRTRLIALVWIVAILGILYTRFKTKLPLWAQHRFVYTGLFVAMGWILILRIQEIVQNLSGLGLSLLVAGGLSYTIGAVIYATKRPVLFENVFGFHELWHLLVLAGASFHYALILSFYL